MRDLKRLRIAAGKSREHVAKEVGVTAACVGLWETHERVPSVKYIEDYARALGIEPIDLTCLYDKPGPDSVFYGRKPASSAL